MRACVECTGTVTVAGPAEAAFALFMPEGERSWVPDWDPVYPAGGRPAPAPGLAFTTGEGEDTRTWVVARLDSGTRTALYTYVLPGRRTAWIEVMVAQVTAGSCAARVTYRVTSLAPDADAEVRAFRDAYPDMLEDWQRRITGRATTPG